MADARVKILMDLIDGVTPGIKDVKKELGGFEKNLNDMKPVFAGMAAIGTASFAAIAGAAFKGIDAYAESEQQLTRVDAILDTLGTDTLRQFSGGVDQAKDIAREFGAEIQALGGIGDEAAAEGFAKLLKATKDSSKAMDAAGIAADLATYKQIDYGSAVDVVTKVLNGNTGALQKMGIQIDENMTSEQALAALAGLTAGQYEKYGQTINGQIAILNQSIGDIWENIGAALLPALNSVLEVVKPIITGFADWTAKNPELVQQMIMIGGAISLLVAGIGILGLAIGPIITGFGAFAAVAGVLLSPLGLIVIAITAIGAALIYLYNTNETAREMMNSAWTAISTAIGNAATIIGNWITQAIAWLTDLWNNNEQTRANIVQIWTAIAAFIGQAVTMIGDWFIQFGNWLIELWNNNQTTVILIQEIWNAFLSLFSNIFDLIWSVVTALIANFKKFVLENETVKGILIAAWEAFKVAFDIVFKALGEIVNVFLAIILGVIQTCDTVISTLKIAWNNFDSWWGGFWNGLGAAVQGVIDSIIKAINDLLAKIGAAISKVAEFAAAAAKVGLSVVSGGAINIPSIPMPKRASGGPVSPNQSYLVGERRPEVFTPSGYGRIGQTGGGGVTLNISGNNFYGPDDLSDMVMDSLVGKLKNNIMVN